MNEPASRLSLAVLISGTGSNLKALINARQRGELAIDIRQVISNIAEAPGLEHARQAGIPYAVIDASENQDEAVARCLRAAAPDLVLLSGYMRILGRDLVSEFEGRMLNQHPSLLPKYKGLNTYRRVIEAGDTEHGASVHFVTAELDDGPVIAQARIPVDSGDDARALAARLGPLEHRLLLAVIELFTRQQVEMRDGQVHLDGQPVTQPLSFEHDELQAPA